MPASQPGGRQPNAAIFVDLDNLVEAGGRARDLSRVLGLVQRFARAEIRRAYGNWAQHERPAAHMCNDLGFDQIQVGSPGGASEAPLQICVEAMDLVRRTRHLDMVYLVSGEGNLAPLARSLRAGGCQVIGIGQRSRVAEAYRQSCDRFLDLERVVAGEGEESEPRLREGEARPARPADPSAKPPRRGDGDSPDRPPLTELVGMLDDIDVDDDTLTRLDSALDRNGMQFLGADHQDRVLRSLFDILVTQQKALNRSEILAELRRDLMANEDEELSYDQNVLNGVFHILYRAIVFNLAKRADSLINCHWLKPEYRDFDAFRRAHDSRLIQAAEESGLDLSAHEWSQILYEDTGKTDYLAELLDALDSERAQEGAASPSA